MRKNAKYLIYESDILNVLKHLVKALGVQTALTI